MPDPETPEDGIDPRNRLEALDRAVKAALDKRAADQAAADAREARAKQAQAGGAAWRMISNLVLATVLVAAAGYGLDRLFGTTPLGLVSGVFIGFAAGVWMAYQASARLQASQDPPAAGLAPVAKEEEGPDGDLR
jgi:ATP synthase protein I